MLKIFAAPTHVPSELLSKSLFIAGGITDCPTWQDDLLASLEDCDLTILNPRRAEYSVLDPSALREQIAWEHHYLRGASAISFWFPKETLCPITLYELGAWSHWRGADGSAKPLFVGVEPEYKRQTDVQIQMSLERPEIEVVATVELLAQQIRDWTQR